MNERRVASKGQLRERLPKPRGGGRRTQASGRGSMGLVPHRRRRDPSVYCACTRCTKPNTRPKPNQTRGAKSPKGAGSVLAGKSSRLRVVSPAARTGWGAPGPWAAGSQTAGTIVHGKKDHGAGAGPDTHRAAACDSRCVAGCCRRLPVALSAVASDGNGQRRRGRRHVVSSAPVMMC